MFGCCWFLATWLGFAAADSGPRIAVLPVELEGDKRPATLKKLQETLSEALSASSAVAKDATKPCGDDATCRSEQAAATQSDYVLSLNVAASGRDYNVTLGVFDGRSGQSVAELSEDCDICGVSEVAEIVAAQTAAALRRITSSERSARLVIRTEPPGATVKLDGKVIGVTPFTEPLRAGPHELTVELDGYIERRRTLELVEGGEEHVTLELQRVVVKADPRAEKRARIQRGVGWGLVALGVTLAGGGVPLIIIDKNAVKDRCSGNDVDENGLCRFRYKTLAGGIAMGASGVVAAVTGAILVGSSKKARDPNTEAQALRIRPGHGGFTVAF